MFRPQKEVPFFERGPILDALGAIEDTFESLDELKKAINKKCDIESQLIDEFQDQSFELAKEAEINKEKAFDLINDLLKFCRMLNTSEQKNCNYICSEAGTCYSLIKTITEQGARR